MENNKIKGLFDKVGYNTCNNISFSLFVLANAVSATGALLQQPILFGLGTTATFMPIAIMAANSKRHTYDFLQIKKLYDEFIKNYNKLNKTFDLSDPIQISTMLNYLVKKGYLSYGKRFFELCGIPSDIERLYGADVISGEAVCRHIAAMLNDILNDYGIESNMLAVYYNYYYEIFNGMNDECEKISGNYGNSIANKISRKIGNHMITFAFMDGKNYFLDPTNAKIYHACEDDIMKLHDVDSEVIISLFSSRHFNKKEDYIKLKERLLSNSPSVSEDEMRARVNSTLAICNSNMDVFEGFYKENSGLYREITAKLRKFKA